MFVYMYSMEVNTMEEELQQEFDSIFEGDEAANMVLKLTSSSFKRSVKSIRIEDIGDRKSVV